MYVFEVVDKYERRIHLSKERWRHVRKKHPEVLDEGWVKETLLHPDKVTESHPDESVYYFYKYFKHRVSPNKFLRVLVKYINSEGYVLTAYFEPHIR